MIPTTTARVSHRKFSGVPARAIPYQPLVNARTIPDGLLLHMPESRPSDDALVVKLS